ncbi:MAG TPA: division/cell wall cluster transcriptional repressor MraZ [Aliidongia sp.]|uniref:division/cell wall cluster transcriptional repressor MraZ n=1 Tax=Aliidongia sp. TaxID=1914230 RepID=UPI002DDD16D9|nr:division/cell wall cluster transcriptional repressor MraZ [Aliidongia sp.]HEV2676713.1 division/cell wall cluster transcriptional repressor MraZ [Aliidongia sp.]
MRLFLSTYVNKIDRKGRVSVPALFRTVLSGQNSTGILAFRSFKHAALDCSGLARVEEMAAQLETLPEFSEEYENLSALFADMKQLQIDGEGRITLPEELLQFVGITDNVAFVGQGKNFQIWEPAAQEAFQAARRQSARDNKFIMPPTARMPAPAAEGTP